MTAAAKARQSSVSGPEPIATDTCQSPTIKDKTKMKAQKEAKRIAPKSNRDLKKLEKHLWQKLEKQIGVGLFMDMLEQATNEIIDDVEDRPSVRSGLFTENGKLTAMGRDLVESSFHEVINPEFMGNCSMGLIEHLTDQLDKEAFDFFESERSAGRRMV